MAGAYPQPPEFVDFVQPEVYDLGSLTRSGVLGRGVTSSEARGAQIGRAIYNDLPENRDRAADPRVSSATRMDVHAVREISAAYDRVFGPPGEERFDAISMALGSAFDEYMRRNDLADASRVDPAEFRLWLRSEEALLQTAIYFQELADMLRRLRAVGLSAQEYAEARERVLGAIAPSGGFDVPLLIEILEVELPSESAPDPEPDSGLGTAE